MALLGSALTYGLRFPIERAVREEAVRDVEATVPPRIIRIVSPEDLARPMTRARYEEVNQKIKDYAMGSGVVRLKLWNAAGTVAYSTLPEQIGDSYPENEEFLEAFQGETVWEVSHETEALEERALGELMEVYIPLTWQPGDKPGGVVEVYLSYAPFVRHLASIRNAIFLAVGIASLTLPLVLYLLYRTGWKAIQRERDTAAENFQLARTLNITLLQHVERFLDLQRSLHVLRARAADLPGGQSQEIVQERYSSLVKGIQEFANNADAILGPLLATASSSRLPAESR